MRNWKVYISLLVFASCADKMDKREAMQVGTTDCRSVPAFVKNTPINPSKTAFSTSQERQKGVRLLEYGTTKVWQDSTWDDYGYFGQLTTSNIGQVFLAPTPMINAASEPDQGFNTLFSIDPNTGVLAPFFQLSPKQSYHTDNPFGILGISYDCSANVVYATSVYGSTKSNESGVIYAIDVATQSILDTYEGVDAFGCMALGTTGEKKLYYGSARNSNIYSIELDKTGKFIGKSREEFSLDMLGPRGDDKAKKMRFTKGKLIITGYEFMYNLIAPADVQETQYTFMYDRANKTWNHNP